MILHSGFQCPSGRAQAELPTLPRVSVAAIAKKTWNLLFHSVAGAAQQIGEKSLQAVRATRISAATRLHRLAPCQCIRLRLGARLRLCQGPSLPTNVQWVHFSDEKVCKCEYFQHPQNFRYWVDRTQKRMDCADLLRTDRSQVIRPRSLDGMASQACTLCLRCHRAAWISMCDYYVWKAIHE